MSYEPNLNVIESVWPDSQIIHEIQWCHNRIDELQSKLEKKPSTRRQITDLFRQISDKEKVLNLRKEGKR